MQKKKTGLIEGSTSMQLIRETKKVKDFNLRTGDVQGATVVKDSWKRNFNRDPNSTGDIKGAQASTVKKLETRRRTCPLNPKYKSLDTPPASPKK